MKIVCIIYKAHFNSAKCGKEFFFFKTGTRAAADDHVDTFGRLFT